MNVGHKTLAWHETLELHEITAFNSIGLMKLKHGVKMIQDQGLKSIYLQSIKELEISLKELLKFYPHTPKPGNSNEYRMDTEFYASDLLAFLKSSVRNYAVAITETASHELRVVLTKQLNLMILAHERIFVFMYKNGHYPSYDLNALLKHDVQMANKALEM